MTMDRRTRLASAVALTALVGIVLAVVTWTVVDRIPALDAPEQTAGAGQPGDDSSPLPPRGTVGPASSDELDQRTIFQTNFDRPGLRDWTVTREGASTARVVPGLGRNGSGAAQLVVPDDSATNRAFLAYRLDQQADGVSASGWFKVVAGGCNPEAKYSYGNVPFFRFFDASGQRLVSLFRVNGDCSTEQGSDQELWLQHSGRYHRTLGSVGLGEWHHLTLTASTGPDGKSLIEVDLDEQRVYRTRGASNGTAPIASVTTHNEVPGQEGELVVDQVRLATFDPGTQRGPTCAGEAGDPPTSDASGTVAVADDFESGRLVSWSQADVNGAAKATVASGAAHRGACGLRLEVGSAPSAAAKLLKDLPAKTNVVTTQAWYRVDEEGAPASNVPLIRIFTGDRRVLDVHRQNRDGRLGARTLDGSGNLYYHPLGTSIDLDTWHEVRVELRTTNASGSFSVELDGQTIYESGKVPLVKGALTAAVLGSEHGGQKMALDIDDIVVTAGER